MKQASKKISLEQWILGITAVVVIYAAVIATLNFSNASDIGYVNSSTLLEKYPGAIEAREKLNDKVNEWKKNIKTLEDEFKQMNQEMVAKAGKWNKKTLNSKKNALQKKQQEFARYNRAIQEKAVKTEQELMQPVYDEINNYMKDFGKANGYQMIFGTVAGGNILFAEDAVDLTEDFLSYAKNQM